MSCATYWANMGPPLTVSFIVARKFVTQLLDSGGEALKKRRNYTGRLDEKCVSQKKVGWVSEIYTDLIKLC